MSVTAIRRKYLLRLLAELDQRIAEAKSLADSRFLTTDERALAISLVSENREDLVRVEKMLTESGA